MGKEGGAGGEGREVSLGKGGRGKGRQGGRLCPRLCVHAYVLAREEEGRRAWVTCAWRKCFCIHRRGVHVTAWLCASAEYHRQARRLIRAGAACAMRPTFPRMWCVCVCACACVCPHACVYTVYSIRACVCLCVWVLMYARMCADLPVAGGGRNPQHHRALHVRDVNHHLHGHAR